MEATPVFAGSRCRLPLLALPSIRAALLFVGSRCLALVLGSLGSRCLGLRRFALLSIRAAGLRLSRRRRFALSWSSSVRAGFVLVCSRCLCLRQLALMAFGLLALPSVRAVLVFVSSCCLGLRRFAQPWAS